MRFLFHLGHPAHYHLFKHVIARLREGGHETPILIKKKDVLEDLLNHAGLPYRNILPEGRRGGSASFALGMMKRMQRMLRFCREHRPDVLVGTSVEISWVGRVLGIPSVNVNEDDWDVVPRYAWSAYPLATVIVAPDCCRMGRWEGKTVHYPGYHELAYLHPARFTPDPAVVRKYFSPDESYVVLRFAQLTAHHDKGIRGLDADTVRVLMHTLKEHAQVRITSERTLEPEFESFRLRIDPTDMHHILAHARLYIGDSQTMAAEAGVLGVPFIRCNDFVGKIGYLAELEGRFRLGYGIRPGNAAEIARTAVRVLANRNTSREWTHRREVLLQEKVDAASFIGDFLMMFRGG